MSEVFKMYVTKGQARIMLSLLEAHKERGEYWGKKINHYASIETLISTLKHALEENDGRL